MNTGDRLVIRPRPKAGESCTGYLLRLTEENAYPTLSYVLRAPEGNTGGFAKASTSHRTNLQWRALESRVGLPEGSIRRRWPELLATEPFDTPVAVGLLVLAKADMVLGVTSICPECVREDGFCHSIWEVRYYTVCHRHRKLMVSHCPACRTPLSATRPKMLSCGTCEADLVEGMGVSEMGGWAVSDVIARGAAHLTISPDRYTGTGIGGLPVENVAATVASIRLMVWLTKARFTQWMSGSLPIEVRHQQLLEVLPLFWDWPTNWRASLDSLVEGTLRGKSGYIGQALGRHVKMLDADRDEYRFVQDAFAAWVTERQPTIWRSKAFAEVLPKWQKEPALLTTNEVAEILGCSPGTVQENARKGRIVTVEEAFARQKRLFLTRESVHQLRDSQQWSLNWIEARKILKVDPRLILDPDFRILLEAETEPKTGKITIQRSRVEWLLSAIEDAVDRDSHHQHLVGMRSAVVFTRPAGGTYASLILWIVGGKLPVRAFRRAAGLRSIRFERRDLMGLVARELGYQGRPNGKCGLIAGLSRKMQANHRTADELIAERTLISH